MHHWGYFPWFGFLVFLLFFGFFIANMIMWRRNGLCHRGSYNTLEMLEKRFVSGEIDELEFKKIKENLKK